MTPRSWVVSILIISARIIGNYLLSFLYIYYFSQTQLSDVVIPRMKLICPWTNVIVMLRNPVERAFSQYQMCIDTAGSAEQLKVRGESSYRNKSFEAVVREEIAQLRELGISPTCSFELFREKVLRPLPMTHGGHSIVARGLYVLQVRQWAQEWPADQLRVYSINEIKGTKSAVQATMEEVFAFLHLPPHDLEDVEAKNTRSYAPMPEVCRQLLEEFYAPYNAKLFEMLNRELVW